MSKISKIIFAFVALTAIVNHQVYAQQPSNQENIPQFLYGIVSWYGDSFDGKKTASGDVYSPTALTAAHRSLPFGTRIEVENLSNGKKVEVIVNDRGPFAKNRILDISKLAAEILDILQDGTSFAKITILELGSGLASPTPSDMPVGQDIPQTLAPAPLPVDEVAPVSTTSDDFDALFADADEEADFMDSNDLLAAADTTPKTQAVPAGFQEVEDDFLVNDPLEDLALGDDDEFVEAPVPALIEDQLAITPEDKRILDQQQLDDPFADLFDGVADPYDFQNALNENSTDPLMAQNPIAPNINENPSLPVESKPLFTVITNNVAVTNTVTLTNTVTVADPIPNIPSEPMSAAKVLTPEVVPNVQMQNHYIVQLGAFSKQSNAMGLYEDLRNAGFNAFITDVKLKGRNMIRVRVGYFTSLDDAIQASETLRSQFPLDNRIILIETNK